MGKTLRLGFVMGGGVSLGTFSGAALAETIKQQIVYGQYDTGEKDEAGNPVFAPYEKVELDVFSGASAGAIALAIMVRVLTNPKDKYSFLGYNSYQAMRTAVEDKLAKQFEGKLVELKMKFPQKFEQLIAAQVVQEFQEKVWAKEVDIERFLGVGSFHKDLSGSASFLDRGVIDNLGRRIFQFQKEKERLTNRVLLGERVLFACTLANLSHTLRHSQKTVGGQEETPSLFKALNDSSVDRIHSELRVFDINFKTIQSSEGRYYPLKWVQFHTGKPIEMAQEDNRGYEYQKKIRSLQDNDAWREITATAIASAAFPFAFEPVVLNRYRYEFGQQWAKELEDKQSYPFTYVDGGIFNNEPIKEAMRLASYLDAISEDKNFERQLIFVDPNVTELENQFRITAHEKLSIGRTVLSGQSKISKKPTILRMFSKLSHLLSAVLNEAQSIEVGRITETLHKFERRKKMRAFYRQTVVGEASDESIIEMRAYIVQELQKVREKLTLPANTLQVQHEFIRICEEEAAFLKEHLPLDDERALLDQINAFVHVPQPSQVENAPYWVFVMSCLSLDVSMDLIGKNAHTQLVPIAPFDFYSNEKEFNLLKLPGGSMAGFAGFASHEASQYELEYGKYCAKRILEELGLIGAQPQALPCPAPFDYRKLDYMLRKNLREAIVKRVKEMVPKSIATIMPFLEGYLNENVEGFINKNIDGSQNACSFEFRIRVPNDVLVLRGFTEDGRPDAKKNIKPIYIKGRYYIISKLMYDFEQKEWRGLHTNFMQNIYIDKEKLFDDVPRVSIELPIMSMQNDAYLSPNPIFRMDARSGLNLGKYTELSSKHWEFVSDITPLDTNLWDVED